MSVFPTHPHTSQPTAAVVDLAPDLRQSAIDHAEAAQMRVVTEPQPGCAVVLTGLTGLANLSSAAGSASLASPDAPVIVLTSTAPRAADWRRALDAGAASLRILPGESADLLADLAGVSRRPGRGAIITVVPGSGGAGATSLAARLAGAAARTGRPVTLVDADPSGPGMEHVIGAAHVPGAHWPDFADADAADGSAIRSALPQIDGIHLLTGPVPAAATVGRILTALTSVDGFVVVDAGLGIAAEIAPLSREVLMVVHARDLAVRSAVRRAEQLREAAPSMGIAVRRHGDVGVRDVRADLDLPVAMSFRDSRPGVQPVVDVRRGGADAACAAFWSSWEARS